MGEKVTAKCNPKVCNFHGGGRAGGEGGRGRCPAPRTAVPAAARRASPRRRGGQRLETYPGSCWESLALPEVPWLPFASISEPPRPPTPKKPSPTAIGAERRPAPSPEISRSLLPLLLPPARAPPNLSASGGAGAAARAVTRGLGLAQPRCSHTPPSPPPRPIPTSPPPPPHPHLLLLLLPLLPGARGAEF